MELCESKQLFRQPLHPYTKGLLAAIPIPSIHVEQEEIIMSGEVTSPINPKPGCRFESRCPYSKDVCREKQPKVEEILPGHLCACHLVREINGL
jgi:peptide/nickel transport system ATP-binding protein